MSVIITNMEMPSGCWCCEFGRRWDNASTMCDRKPFESPVEDGNERPIYCPLKETSTEINGLKWNKIEGYNHDLAGFANRENGVQMPDVGSIVILLSDDRKRFFVSIACEESVDGTRYHDGMIWACLNPPIEYEGF